MPKALPANTVAVVQTMFDDGHFCFPEPPCWDGRFLDDIEEGTHLLWKGVPTGQHGGESTKVELFHGECLVHDECEYIDDRDSYEVIVRSPTTGQCLKIHHSYLVGDPNREYCISGGGRWYPIRAVWDQLLRAVKCSLCYKQFDSEEAYEAHYQDKHSQQ